MTGMPVELYVRCRMTLIRCDDFKSQAKLRAVFGVGELNAFQSGIPEGNSWDERVDLVIDYLQSRYLAQKRPALAVLLQVLHLIHQEEEDLAAELAALHNEVDRFLSNVKWINLPLVVVAMKASEAAQILGPPVYLGEEQSEGKGSYDEEFTQYGFGWNSVGEQYGQEREDWRPYPGTDQSIRAIITEVIQQINQGRDSDGAHSVVRAVTYSESFFSTDQQQRIEIYKALSRSGCMLVIDPLSLFNPRMVQCLAHSGLVLNEQRVATIVLSPFDLRRTTFFRRVEQQIGDAIPMALARHEDLSDSLFEFGVADLLALKRSLYRVIPGLATLAEGLSLQAANRGLAEKYGQPQGIHRLFPGVRG